GGGASMLFLATASPPFSVVDTMITTRQQGCVQKQVGGSDELRRQAVRLGEAGPLALDGLPLRLALGLRPREGFGGGAALLAAADVLLDDLPVVGSAGLVEVHRPRLAPALPGHRRPHCLCYDAVNPALTNIQATRPAHSPGRPTRQGQRSHGG